MALILLTATMVAPAQRRAYQGNYQTVSQLIRRIETRATNFRNNLDNTINRGTYDLRTQRPLNRAAVDFQNAVNQLRSSFDRRQATSSEVQTVLDRATQIDNLISQVRLNNATQSNWDNLRTDLNELARTFNLSWSSDVGNYPSNPTYPTNSTRPTYRQNLTGTYRLDASRSDDPSAAANRAVQTVPLRDRQRVRDLLTARLESPDQIAIDRNGRTVTIASSRAPQITFDADGTERSETTRNGRTIRARAALLGDQLTVSSTGDRGNDFSVTFDPIDSGRRLQVTRRVYVDGLTSPVQVQSVYDRTSDVASFDIYNGPQTNPSYPTGSNGDFTVRNGDTVVAALDESLSTRTAREGDRFRMTVRQPAELAGATIEGHITNVERSGRLTGRSQLTLDFDTIRLRNGRSYRFAGIVESLRRPTGDIVKVDNEGTVRDDNQTTKTAERAAIGTAVGAIIGAIAGGGKGAAIGAIVGAGGGAGSVYVQGKDDLDLERDTEVVIRASSPQ